MSAAGRAAPFSAIAIAAVVIVGAIGFAAFLVLSAYAPDYQPVKNGGGHAYSTSAVGFVGAAELVRQTHGGAGVIRRDTDLSKAGLVVLTPGPQTDPVEIKSILDRRKDIPTLIVMPKWIVTRLRNNPAWVREYGAIPGFYLQQMLDDIAKVQFSDPQGRELRSIHGTDLRVIDSTPEGQPLLVGVPDTEIYILADPDVLNNQGLATRSGAERAMKILDEIALPDESIAFDLTLMGFGKNPNLLKLAFEPPFLPLTLILLAAALLAGLHAIRRFGPAAREERAVAFGKRALAENGAALLRLARRRHRTGGRYAVLTRDAVAAASGAPPSLTGEALDRYLDRLSKEGEPYSQIAARAQDAPDTRRLLAAARDLYHWRRTVTREHR
ncbi:hypothetical protein OF829_13245 [Sphingomonas sp. LB-2]|uniref:hypothetical protein n=1 Tax=Sphingomonas caeni TaxID=2984949 RepID=UPI00222EF75E|nr:hypothetical protein [Sphingomonas caeni]MCW3848205.1 hypothetical protein [Sphingomonas caeni]